MVVVICLSPSDDSFIQHSLGANPIEQELMVVLLSKLAPPVAHWARTGAVADSTHVAPRPTVPQPGRHPATQTIPSESHTYELPSQGSNLSIISRVPAPTRDRNNPGRPGWHPSHARPGVHCFAAGPAAFPPQFPPGHTHPSCQKTLR